MRNDELIIALPKGKLGEDALDIFQKIGLPAWEIQEDSRKLSYCFNDQGIKYLICRPTDIPTYVEYGAADIGIVGKDTLEESRADVFEICDLGYGYCKFVVAIPKDVLEKIEKKHGAFNLKYFTNTRVATKFPRITKNFFNSKGIQVEVLKLHGNVELAPAVGLSEMIVDLVSTGRTLKENNLVAVEEISEITARLIANRVSYRIKNSWIQEIVTKCNQIVDLRGKQ
ncbi:MAG: ATP phosphoribosyltransferase [Bacillota bacterium]